MIEISISKIFFIDSNLLKIVSAATEIVHKTEVKNSVLLIGQNILIKFVHIFVINHFFKSF